MSSRSEVITFPLISTTVSPTQNFAFSEPSFSTSKWFQYRKLLSRRPRHGDLPDRRGAKLELQPQHFLRVLRRKGDHDAPPQFVQTSIASDLVQLVAIPRTVALLKTPADLFQRAVRHGIRVLACVGPVSPSTVPTLALTLSTVYQLVSVNRITRVEGHLC